MQTFQCAFAVSFQNLLIIPLLYITLRTLLNWTSSCSCQSAPGKHTDVEKLCHLKLTWWKRSDWRPRYRLQKATGVHWKCIISILRVSTLVLFKYMCIFVSLCLYIRRRVIYNVYVQRVSSQEGRDNDDQLHHDRLRTVGDERYREEAAELSRAPPPTCFWLEYRGVWDWREV